MKIGKIIIFGIVIAILVMGVSMLVKKDSYIGFYYPDANDLTNDIQSEHTFDTLGACRDWISDKVAMNNPDGSKSDDYECGKNCDLSKGKPYVCEETLE